MAGNLNIKNANGKTLTIQNPDTNNADIVIDGSKIASTVSPIFTGNPVAPTQAAGDNSTKLATTAYVDGKMVTGTVVNATGTAVDFTGIPSWVKRITIMLNGVSTNGSSSVQIQLGTSGGIENTGYYGASTNSSSTSNYTTGFGIHTAASVNSRNGNMVITNLSLNSFSQTHNIGLSDTTIAISGGGAKTLSGKLDRVRITTVNGTDTFDAGQINILYEG